MSEISGSDAVKEIYAKRISFMSILHNSSSPAGLYIQIIRQIMKISLSVATRSLLCSLHPSFPSAGFLTHSPNFRSLSLTLHTYPIFYTLKYRSTLWSYNDTS